MLNTPVTQTNSAPAVAPTKAPAEAVTSATRTPAVP